MKMSSVFLNTSKTLTMDSSLASPSPDWHASSTSGSGNEVEFAFMNTHGEFAQLVPQIEGFLEKNAISFKDQYVIQLCLEEAIINVINHGYPTQVPDTIKLTMSVNPEFVRIALLDHGISFNPLDQPESDIELSVEDRSIGGLGIHLMRHYLQDMTYHRIDNTNQLSFSRKRELNPVSG